MASAPPSTEGVLIIDKPRGLTSHDVVAKARRVLRERRVGHAGTLDPLATGVLLILLGEGTKLAPYLTAADKRYVARIALGTATTTLDADGEVTAKASISGALRAEIDSLAADLTSDPNGQLACALRAEMERTAQIPPLFSAIQIGGERSYDLARAGKAVELEPRAVSARSLRLIAAASGDEPWIDLDVLVSKGYYVRSLARDLGERLGVPAHIAALRRVESGAFHVADAVPIDAGEARLRDAILPLSAAICRSLPVATLTEDGALRARHGKRVRPHDFEGGAPPHTGAAVWLDGSGRIVAIGAPKDDGAFAVLRGFSGT